MITKYDFGFCNVEIYDDYVKVVINEGETVSPEHNETLIELANAHFKNRPFVYITHRIYSYSVNPTIYLETSKIENLVGFAVVSTNHKQKIQTKLEKAFFEKEFRQFDTMEEALSWKNEIIHKYMLRSQD